MIRTSHHYYLCRAWALEAPPSLLGATAHFHLKLHTQYQRVWAHTLKVAILTSYKKLAVRSFELKLHIHTMGTSETYFTSCRREHKRSHLMCSQFQMYSDLYSKILSCDLSFALHGKHSRIYICPHWTLSFCLTQAVTHLVIFFWCFQWEPLVSTSDIKNLLPLFFSPMSSFQRQ